MAGYLLNIFYITVLYHRGLTHGAVRLTPLGFKLLNRTGNWVTGIDPKGWACLHRFHHLHSDTPDDPHSPVHQGVLGVALGQLRSYERALGKLIRKDPKYMAMVEDIPFGVNVLNRKRMWALPYFVHVLISFVLYFATGHALIAIGYYLGIMSHPIQGWMVNSLGHYSGYRNYDSPDNSRNNTWVAWTVFGEGYQNNHHAAPEKACFAHRSHEVDLGYLLCRLGAFAGLLTIPERETEAVEAHAS